MPDGKSIVAYALSSAALLGPVAYILFAFHDRGRLSYFGAPDDFMQISSLGLLPVVEVVYPAMFFTMLIVGLLSGLRYASHSRQVVLVAVAWIYVSMVLMFLSSTSFWQWVFGGSMALGAITALMTKNTQADVGNELPKLEPMPVSDAEKHFALIYKCVLLCAGIAIAPMCFVKAGMKTAAAQEYYWVIGDQVILGFYGDLALMGGLSLNHVGPTFRFAELKSLEKNMTRQRIGPLSRAPTTKLGNP